jgi:hypothetical protein
MEDCENIFGYYLHHDPSFTPELEEQKLAEQYDLTLSLYKVQLLQSKQYTKYGFFFSSN